jgi:TonB family protein
MFAPRNGAHVMARLTAVALLGLSLTVSACTSEPVYDPEVDSDLARLNTDTGVVCKFDECHTGNMGPNYVVPACTPSPEAAGISGIVEVAMQINADGSVASAWLLKSAVTKAGCDEAAVRSIRQSTFWPALKDGKRVKIKTRIFMAYPEAFTLTPSQSS